MVNVLFYRGAGILCDLESAKKTTDITIYEVRMACSLSFSALFTDPR
jgi:hypothetical protein